MKTIAGSLIAMALLALEGKAFWDKGHLLISRRAQAILEDEAPEAFDQALTVLSYLEQSHPSLTDSEGDFPFTECATFADIIKGRGYSWQSGWHFIDQPYLSDGGSIEDYPDFQMDDEDVLGALSDLTAFLKGESSAQDSVYVQTIQDSFSDVKDQQSFALRLIIHYVGDIHQPLHATAMVNDYYPKGDIGGNREYINPNVDGVGNLHSVWDSIIYTHTGYESLPLSQSAFDGYTAETTEWASEYPVTSDELDAGDFQTWADQSLQLSEDFVYADYDYKEHQIPTDEYKESRIPIVQRQIMVGGARLAALIEDIYGTNVAEEIASFLQ